jgi:hypothetical protein
MKTSPARDCGVFVLLLKVADQADCCYFIACPWESPASGVHLAESYVAVRKINKL